MHLIYNFSILFYGFIIRVLSLFNPKAKKWISGRKNIWKQLENFKRNETKLFWFHCASLGEFEQGRPLIEALKKKEKCQIIVSFFSPSGYEIRKDYELADMVFYLPIDTPKNAKKLVNILKPTKVFFIKYEFWANYIFELKYNNIPVYLVSGLFRKKQLFFKNYGSFFRKILKSFDEIFVQDEASYTLLNDIDIPNVISGDTRYDRVLVNASFVKSIDIVESFLKGKKAFVIGSSWEEDENIIFPLIKNNSIDDLTIIAPHEIKEVNILRIEGSLTGLTIRYSDLLKGVELTSETVLIIDNIGMLMNLYQYASMAYIGGGFKTGLHNILEAASYNVPVVFGNKHEKFPEAKLFIDNKIGFEISNSESLITVIKNLRKTDLTASISQFMISQCGATKKVLELISK